MIPLKLSIFRQKTSKMMRRVVCTVFMSFLTTICMAQPSIDFPEQKVRGWQNSKMLANSGVGISVCDMRSGRELIQSSSWLSLAPASILKLVTTATALEVLGPDFRFKTSLIYTGTIRNDTLWGDLLVVGGGDPTLGSEYFPENIHFLDDWMKSIDSQHFHFVSGNLVVDSSIYEKIQVPGSWVWEDLGNYYGAGASGLSVYDNLFEIHLQSPEATGKPTRILKSVPEIPGLEIRNEVLSSDVNSDQSYVYGSPDDTYRVIRGTIPKGRDNFVVKASMPDPSAVLANEFMKKLKAVGVKFRGSTLFEKSGQAGYGLAETLSPPLSEIIKVTNHESVNLFAEHLLKHLAWHKYGLGTTDEGCKFVLGFWKEKGIDSSGLFMNDGSGLSRFDGITPAQMTTILNYMASKSAYSEYFMSSLPVAGEGTLTAFNPDHFPQNCLHAKSGSMTRVRCYAGYLKTDSGRELSFAIMLNNFSCSMKEVTHKVEELLIELRKL